MKVLPKESRLKADRGDVSAARPVLRDAFGVLTALRRRGSELELGSGLPPAAVRRLLIELENIGAVESTGGLLVIGVLPGRRRLAFEPAPGIALADPRPALARASRQTRGGPVRSRAAASEPKERACPE